MTIDRYLATPDLETLLPHARSSALHLGAMLDDLLFLAALVIIRTIVAFFLNREIQEIEAEIDK